MKKALTSLMALAVLLVLSFCCQAVADTIVGSSNGENCYPFSCGGSDGLRVFQQVYSSSAFPGPITFDMVTFFKSSGGPMDTNSYVVSFSTTSKPVMGLDLFDYANNVGPDEQFFGSYALSGDMPDTLVLNGNAFNYNPANGNLLMTVQLGSIQVTPSNYQSFFQADYTGIVTSRIWYLGQNPTEENDIGGLVTGFNGNEPIIPEPSTIALLGLGLAATVLAARCHRIR